MNNWKRLLWLSIGVGVTLSYYFVGNSIEKAYNRGWIEGYATCVSKSYDIEETPTYDSIYVNYMVYGE